MMASISICSCRAGTAAARGAAGGGAGWWHAGRKTIAPIGRLRSMRTAAFVIGLAFIAGVQAPAERDVHLTLHEGTNMAAALSPDGRTIAIDLLGTIWTLPASGGRANAITDIFMDARQPSWSPDGRKIAFQAYRTTTWQIWTMNADGSDLRAVTESVYDDREPVWSPDGRRIAFSSDRAGNYDIWTLTVGTGDLRQVTSAPSNEFMPSWRSNDDIAFVSDRAGAPGIYSAPDRLLAPADGALAAPAFGPEGAIAFNAISASHSRLLVDGRNIADADEDVFPFRPQWIGADLLYTADGKIKRRAPAGGPARVIEFSADVSFTRPDFTPKPHRLNPTGPQVVHGIMHPVVSPDGQQVAFAALGDLWTASLAGAAKRLTDDAAVETDPAWSPDGRSLAYSSDRSGSMQIWIRDLQSGADRQLTRTPGAPMQAAWSPDGSRIAFTNADGEVFAADATSGTISRIHGRLNEAGRPSWSPDGKAVVVSALNPNSTRFREGT